MNSVVIVALPSVDDKVNKISSEKVPHLTLCFLGEDLPADALIEIVEFTQHAASQLSPFGMTVDYRGTLGPDSADVLFFENGHHDGERIKSFRAHLLQNDTIQRAYQNAPQYPEWTPHLTLGYPETPAHEDTSDYPGVHYIQFDRIAVWMGDFEGPEFRLKYDDYPMEMAMSSMDASTLEGVVDKVLKHYGKKGMRWGVTTVDKATKPTLQKEKDMRVLSTKEVTVTQRRAGTYAKARGGQRHKATDDAVRAVAARQKAKKSTTDSLTNDELKAAVERMQLEQKFSQLDAKTKRRGEGFISRLFRSPEGKQMSADLAKKVAALN